MVRKRPSVRLHSVEIAWKCQSIQTSIKTYKVRFASNKKVQTVAEPLPLVYDKKCFSWNEFKAAANFESGYSYAAELIPAEMNVHGVPFKLETREELNGMACKGNVLKLPAD